jgi:hypothetical protein
MLGDMDHPLLPQGKRRVEVANLGEYPAGGDGAVIMIGADHLHIFTRSGADEMYVGVPVEEILNALGTIYQEIGS